MSEEEARRSVAEASREAESAKIAGERARAEFEAIEQRQRAGLPPTPRGPPPEARKHRKFEPEQLEGFKPEPVAGTTARLRQRGASGPSRPRPARSRRLTFPPLFRSRPAGGRPPNRPDSPANIDVGEKQKALSRLDGELSKANRRYTFHIVHGGSDQKKLEDRQRIQQLENEKRAVENMKPLGWKGSIFTIFDRPKKNMAGHVARAERG